MENKKTSSREPSDKTLEKRLLLVGYTVLIKYKLLDFRCKMS